MIDSGKLVHVPLHIPYLELSKEILEGGRIESHLLTPFGFIDVMVDSAGEQPTTFVIQVQGDTDCWMLDASLPEAFIGTLTRFILGIVSHWLGDISPESANWEIRFPLDNNTSRRSFDKCEAQRKTLFLEESPKGVENRTVN